MRPRCIFLYLLPETEIILKLRESRMCLLQNQRVILEFFLRQKHFNKLAVSFVLLLDAIFPKVLLLWQKTQDYLPAVLSDDPGFIRNAVAKVFFQFCDVYLFLVEDIHQTCHLFSYYRREVISCKHFGIKLRLISSGF